MMGNFRAMIVDVIIWMVVKLVHLIAVIVETIKEE